MLTFSMSAASLTPVYAFDRGIYITSATMSDDRKIDSLIEKSLETGINVFVVDVDRGAQERFAKNISKLAKNNIEFVARIVVFPEGGTRSQVTNQAYWEKRFKYVQKAVDLGAKQIQLDYIRYKTANRATYKNVEDVHNVIKWFRSKIPEDIGLQADVFGEASYKVSINIGHDVQAFDETLDYICPMVYPSHYQPYAASSRKPYTIIYDSLTSLKELIRGNKAKIIAWIEARNHRSSAIPRVEYLKLEIKAVEDADVAGFYVWSPLNQYQNLFTALSQMQQDKAPAEKQ